MSLDLLIYETGTGGDMYIRNEDLAMSSSLIQSVYFALFGGRDWWANELLFPENENKQYKSKTIDALLSVPATTAGMISIQRAAEADLSGIMELADTSVNIRILAGRRFEINVRLTESEDLVSFVWDEARRTVIIEKNIL